MVITISGDCLLRLIDDGDFSSCLIFLCLYLPNRIRLFIQALLNCLYFPSIRKIAGIKYFIQNALRHRIRIRDILFEKFYGRVDMFENSVEFRNDAFLFGEGRKGNFEIFYIRRLDIADSCAISKRSQFSANVFGAQIMGNVAG